MTNNKKQDNNQDKPEPNTAPKAEPEADDVGEAQETGESQSEATSAEEPSLEAQLIAVQEEVVDLNDRVLRERAELENLRKRFTREQEDTAKYAIAGFARDLLGVADNLGRALDTLPEDAREDASIKSFIDGVELTGRELVAAFEKHGIREVHPKGEKFDHNLHQAMFEVESDDLAPGTVTAVIQIGYVIGERLLRAAMVGVARPPKENTEDAADKQADDAPDDEPPES